MAWGVLRLVLQLLPAALGDAGGEVDEEVRGAMSTFCPHLDEIPDMFTTFWQRLHSAVLQLEREFALDAQAPGYEIRALCVQLAFLRSIVKGQAGLPFPQAVNSCPTLMAIYFEWASGLAERAHQPRRARALMQLGAPLQLMALSRAMMRPGESKQVKDTQSTVSTQYAEKLQKLKGTAPPSVPWLRSKPGSRISRVAVRSLCDANYQGGNLENGTFNVTEKNHRSYAEKWGYDYEMLFRSPLSDQEPQFGKLQVAIDLLGSDDPPDYFFWLDCDALVTNRSISLEDLLETYQLHAAHFVVAEEVSGINSGIFLVKGGAERHGLRFLRAAMTSDWRFVWDQTMLLDQMARDSDLYADDMCYQWRTTGASHDFDWAPHFGVVPQQALNLYGQGSALQWGASAWQRGDFILHLAGCPLVELPCLQAFEEIAQWVEESH
ncbi:unnamed protein product [Durusdinium trenchii]|uniref:Uncharacterized protein n=2 Tax=Durusdinium trenchii TaxID=1381693 RepID=A0ABP0JJM2_9DINO